MQGGRQVTVDPLLGLASPLLRARAWPRLSLCWVELPRLLPLSGASRWRLPGLSPDVTDVSHSGRPPGPVPTVAAVEPPRVLSRQQLFGWSSATSTVGGGAVLIDF